MLLTWTLFSIVCLGWPWDFIALFALVIVGWHVAAQLSLTLRVRTLTDTKKDCFFLCVFVPTQQVYFKYFIPHFKRDKVLLV